MDKKPRYVLIQNATGKPITIEHLDTISPKRPKLIAMDDTNSDAAVTEEQAKVMIAKWNTTYQHSMITAKDIKESQDIVNSIPYTMNKRVSLHINKLLDNLTQYGILRGVIVTFIAWLFYVTTVSVICNYIAKLILQYLASVIKS